MQITVNISDAKVSKNPGDTIVTYSLGSCIGVTLYAHRPRMRSNINSEAEHNR